MRSWASDTLLGSTRRGSYWRIALALVIFGGALWLLPSRRPGEDGGHHGPHGTALDAFEKAGVTQLKGGLRGPGFRLRRFPAGDYVALEELGAHLVIVNFWATWCGPCAAEMPTLEALWRRYRDRGLVVLAVSVDRGTPRALLEPYVRHHKLTFPILLDPDLATARAWRVTSLPATYIVKPGGEVAGVVLGAREWDSAEMRALLEMLLPAR